MMGSQHVGDDFVGEILGLAEFVGEILGLADFVCEILGVADCTYQGQLSKEEYVQAISYN